MAMPNFVHKPKLEDYKEQFKDYLLMERKNGILLVRMHTKGGPVKYSYQLHNALAMAWQVIGSDPKNEVMILTSTGPFWIGEFDYESWKQYDKETEEESKSHYDLLYYDATKIVENFVEDIDIPTISVVCGPGVHTWLALLCDITLCTENALFQDAHFMVGAVPGDGQSLTFQALLGIKRAAYFMYTCKTINAKTASEWGLVNEVVPQDKILDRAWEIAEMIMKQPREVRRVTSQLVRRPWKRLLEEDFRFQMAHEFYVSTLIKHKHAFERIKETWGK